MAISRPGDRFRPAHLTGARSDRLGPSAEPPPENAAWLDERLFSRRIVFLRGRIDSAAANRVAAALIALDALNEQPVRFHLNADGTDFASAFALIDAMEAMRAPVHAVAIGEVGALAVGVFAAAGTRSAYPHARFRLTEPKVSSPGGTADQVVAEAGRYLRDLEDLVLRVAAATGQPRHRIEDDFAAGVVLDAEQARDYGLVGGIVTPPGP